MAKIASAGAAQAELVEADPGLLAAAAITCDSEDDCHPKGEPGLRFWDKLGGFH
jgi:hypothetical protein